MPALVPGAPQQPTAETHAIPDLVSFVQSGQIRIPDFQRAQRWGWEDVRRLFDSIVRGYPIGSLLLWAHPAQAERVTLGALTLEAPAREDALWVVDGQQRLTSLASSLSDNGLEDPRFALAYDLARREFVRPQRGKASSATLTLPVLFDLARLIEWFAAHPDAQEHFGEARRVAKLLQEYRVPAYVVRADDEAILRDIFDRMNNFGKRLTRAEVFSALKPRASATGSLPSYEEIAEAVDGRHSFGRIDDSTILQVILARRGADVTRGIRIEFEENVDREFVAETIDDAYRGARDALMRAVDFLQRDARVPHFAFLPYRFLLVVTARFFAHHPEPSPRNRELLRRWFWRTATTGAESTRGGYTATTRRLASLIRPESEDDSVQALLDDVGKSAVRFQLPRTFRGNTAEGRSILCALWAERPRSFSSGQPYSLQDLADPLETKARSNVGALALIVPRTTHEESATRIGNRVFLLGGDDREAMVDVLRGRPPTWDDEAWRAALNSHSVTPDTLLEDDIERFWASREERLQSIVQAFLARMTASAFEDTPPLSSLDLDESLNEIEDDELEGHAAS